MANFIKIGKHRINLDQVTEVIERQNGNAQVFWNYTITGDYGDHTDYSEFSGDEAKLLLALIDQDDETVGRIYARVNPVKAQEPDFRVFADPEPAGVILTDEEIAARDNARRFRDSY